MPLMLNLPTSRFQRIALLTLSPFFILAGLNHFLNPRFYEVIVPRALPNPAALVAISGLFELLGGLGVLPARTRRLAGWGLIALLIAVFPANIDMAQHPDRFAEMAGSAPPRWLLLARLPLQLIFILWVWVATQPRPTQGDPSQ